MTKINIYLNFNGNCEEAFNFYKTVFGGEFPYVGRFRDMPVQENMPPLPDDMVNKIMHISLQINENTMIMGSDTGGEWAAHYKQGNNFQISVNTDTKEELNKLFNALSEGGKITMPLNVTFWGDYFGMLTDKFGINWMFSYNPNQNL